MVKIKVIEDIDLLWDGKSLLIKDFSNMDLSKLELSVIPMECWEGCLFHNTNFSNTNIKFNPRRLKKFYKYDWAKDKDEYTFTSIEGCSFENCDLSYLHEEDMRRVKLSNCNFNNTGLNIDFKALPPFEDMTAYRRYSTINVSGVKFDKNYNLYNKAHWDELYFDIETLKLNPDIYVSSGKLFELIYYSLPNEGMIVTSVEMENYIKVCEDCLKYDKDGYLKYLYNIVKEKTDLVGCYKFFHRIIDGINFKDVDLGDLPKDIFETVNFANCEFDNTTISTDMPTLTSIRPKFIETPSKYISINLPMVNYGSWRDKKDNRMANTPVTFRTNAYVELDRVCNAKCSFCRNNSFNRCKYDLDAIKKSLFQLYPYLDDIVIGGGEPTLRLNDLKSLREFFVKRDIIGHSAKWYIFTNGSLDCNEVKRLNNFKVDAFFLSFDFNISRHAVKDIDNAAIFGLNEHELYNTNALKWIAENTSGTTLCATCFDGGLDSFDKIMEYIIFVQKLGFRRVLLSTTHKDNSSGKNNITDKNISIDNSLFQKVINYLQEYGFNKKMPIYSTGGYISTVLSESNYSNKQFTVAFKEYISKDKLDNSWSTAIKRTFDLSIDPSGQIFENWHQNSGIVDAKKLLKKLAD